MYHVDFLAGPVVLKRLAARPNQLEAATEDMKGQVLNSPYVSQVLATNSHRA